MITPESPCVPKLPITVAPSWLAEGEAVMGSWLADHSWLADGRRSYSLRVFYLNSTGSQVVCIGIDVLVSLIYFCYLVLELPINGISAKTLMSQPIVKTGQPSIHFFSVTLPHFN